MKIKDWLRTRKNWQKGAILGGMAGLIFFIFTLTRGALLSGRVGIDIENLLEFFIFVPIYYIILPGLVGALIGYLISAIKNSMLKWGICLAIIPVVATIVIFFLLSLSGGCKDAGCGLLLFYPFSAVVLFFIGLLIGYIIKKMKKNEN